MSCMLDLDTCGIKTHLWHTLLGQLMAARLARIIINLRIEQGLQERTAFGSISHLVHRRHRRPVSSYYFTISVRELQAKIWEQAGNLCTVLQQHHEENHVVNGRLVFLGWSNDTLRSCAFEENLDLLPHPDRAEQFDRVFKAFAAFYPILKQCEWIIPAALQLPIWPFRYIYTPLATLLTVHVVRILPLL